MTQTPTSQLGSGRVTQWRAIHSEWIKLRSLRSTWFSLLAVFVIIVGLGTLFSALRAHNFNQGIGPHAVVIVNGHVVKVTGPNLRFGGFDPTQVSLRGVFLAQLAIGVLGVLVITGEYGTGMIRSTLAAVPRRLPVLYAKALVFGVTAFVVAEISAFVGFLAGQRALASTHFQASLSTPDAWRAILGAGIYLTLIGLLAVGLGFLVRNTAGALATLVGVVLVLPLLTQALPSPYSNDVGKYLPLNAGTQIIGLTHDSSGLGPWTGLGVTALYAVAALVAGAVMLRRHDG